MARTIRFSTQTVEFLDGSRQRYSLQGRYMRNWVIRLDLLDDRELDQFGVFYREAGNEPFTYTDPATGETPIKCIIWGWEICYSGERSGQSTFNILEVL